MRKSITIPMSKSITIPKDRDPFIVIVNGVKYSYPAGVTTEVPDEVADVIEKYVGAKPKPDPNAGGVSWNDLKDKPFGDMPAVILEEQELQYDAEADGCVATPTHPIHDGDALTIVYDGKSYECNAIFFAQMNGVGFGNLAVIGDASDTGEPFFGAYIDGIVLIIPRDKASHTVKITAVVATKIPTKYLPDGIGGVEYVTVSVDESDNYTASATYDQISEWIRAGKDVKCILGTLVLSLCYSDALLDVSTYMMLYRHEFFCVVDTVYYAVAIDYADEVAYTQVALPVGK